MEPRVTKRERKLYLTYDLPSRIRCSAIYPQPAPNGSTLIFFGHDKTLKALWRGGRRIRSSEADSVEQDSDMIDIDGEEQSQDSGIETAEYEDEEEELDPDCPHPNILYTLELVLGSPVTKIAIPSPAVVRRSESDNQHATVVIATLDGSIHLLRIPLAPPHASHANKHAFSILRKSVQLKHDSSFVRCLSTKIIDEEQAKIIVVAGSSQLELWQFSAEDVETSSNMQHSVVSDIGTLTGISFDPAPRSRELLVVDKFGSVNVYEAFAQVEALKGASDQPLYTLHAPFGTQKDDSPAQPSRKRLLDAQFILGGRCILAVLDDGQWGFWDTTASQASKSLEQFVLSGYLESAVAGDVPEPVIAQKATSALTPMTPNTRKVKSTGFFTAPRSRLHNGPSTGGISVARTSNTAGVTDESVMIWHNNEIYSIPSIQSFWQRSASGSSSLGTLYSPGIARVQGVNLFNESITSISQFAAGSTASGIGQLNTQRDFLVSTESRFTIIQNRVGSSKVFPLVSMPAAESKDQRMLDAGELDLGGMDRILGNMDDRTRKVGFVY